MNAENIKTLFEGIGVIIDDNINNEKDKIWEIKSFFEKEHIPILPYSEIPDSEELKHMGNVSFVLLDWRLQESPEISVTIPDSLLSDNISFIKNLEQICFTPIFIFTNENPDSVIDKLSEENLYDKDSNCNRIFVKNKNDFEDYSSFKEIINSWITQTPSIYVLKKWEKEIKRATTTLFYDLYKISPAWPSIMQRTYFKDIKKENFGIFELINRNLFARCKPVSFTDEALKLDSNYTIKKEDLRSLLECDKYIKKEMLSEYPVMGDVFLEENQGTRTYYINIRPDCDIVRGDKDTELYCLKGSEIKEEDIVDSESRQSTSSGGETPKKYKFNREYGVFLEQTNLTIIPFINNGVIVRFRFENLKIIKWKGYKEKRIGRLIPPYITRLKLQYVSYLQRQGIPAIPIEAISLSSENLNSETL